jgi:hypothetical protein
MQVQKQRVFSGVIRGAGILFAVLGLIPAETSARAPLQAAPFIHVPNLVGYWCVDGLIADSGGNAQDNSGNNNLGTYMAGAIAAPAAPSVPTGNTQSYQFDQASKQYISVGDSPSLSITGSLTIAAWIRRTIDSSVQEGIVEKYDDSAGVVNGYSFRLDANENLSFSVIPASGGPVGISTAPRAIPLNTWTHVAGVYSTSGGTLTNYVNALADPTTASGAPAPTDGSNSLQIGKDYGGNAFNGNIDEVRIYNRALSADEIAILKDGQVAPTALMATGGPGENDLTWTAPANPAGVNLQYSVLRGTSSGIYDTIFNDINTTSFTDTTVTPGTAYYYAVVAVTVMASAPSNESTATAGAGTPLSSASSKHGKAEMNPCGGGAASLPDGGAGVWALAAALLLVQIRRALTRP